jgi:uncharacterized alpha-E superfamily protein
VLSRVAVSLYILGNRLERTEHQARVLRVHAELWLDRARSPNDRFWSRLTELMGWAAADQLSRSQAIELLVGGTTGPSLQALVGEARSAAQSVRPSLSTEVFEQVNALRWRLVEGARHPGLHGYLRGAELGVQLISGLVDETMMYDEERDFLRLGKFVERAGATARLVTWKAAELETPGDEAIEWAAALRCCSSFEAYQARLPSPIVPSGVVEFLLRDPINPRSLRFSAEEALASVRRIDGRDRHGSAQDLLAELAGAVEGMEPGSVAAAPQVLAVEVARLRAAIEESLRGDYFLPGRLAAPMTGDMFGVQPQQQQLR